MADFTQDSERIDDGRALKAMETQGINAINQLKQLKINLPALKTKVADGDIYTVDDITKVQAVIDFLLVEIATI